MLSVPVYVRHTKDAEKVGVIVSEHLVPELVEEDGQQVMKQKPIVGVCWETQRSPAIDYCSPFELEWLAIENVTMGEDEDEEGEEFEEEEEGEVLEAQPN